MSRYFARWTGVLLIAGMLTACSGNAPGTTGGSAPVTTGAEVTTAPAATGAQTTSASTTAQLELTLEELAQYNGKNGKPAYVAVDGIIYDVTNAQPWSGGDHNGFEAGNDLTDEIKNVSPHGVSMLKRVPAVGKIKE